MTAAPQRSNLVTELGWAWDTGDWTLRLGESLYSPYHPEYRFRLVQQLNGMLVCYSLGSYNLPVWASFPEGNRAVTHSTLVGETLRVWTDRQCIYERLRPTPEDL